MTAPKLLGVSRRTYPSERLMPLLLAAIDTGETSAARTLSEQATVTVVLTAGEIGDYAAYIGLGSPEFVSRHGDKLCFEEAQIHFPAIRRDAYRE